MGITVGSKGDVPGKKICDKRLGNNSNNNNNNNNIVITDQTVLANRPNKVLHDIMRGLAYRTIWPHHMIHSLKQTKLKN